MRERIGATSLYYLSLEGHAICKLLPEGSVCRACFTREYPTAVPVGGRTKMRFGGGVTTVRGATGEAEASPHLLLLPVPGGEASASPAPTYAAAGVSLATADAIVDRLRAAVASTATPAVAGAFGAFAGLFAIDRAAPARRLDRLGRLEVRARASRRPAALVRRPPRRALHQRRPHDGGRAAPLPRLRRRRTRSTSSRSRGLIERADVPRRRLRDPRRETAELPGIYGESELDFCGTSDVRVVDRYHVVDGSRVEAGDLVIGFASAGIHANGFSLVRRIVGDGGFDADLLLPPTRLYLGEVRARGRADVRALAHATAAASPGRPRRVLPDGLGGHRCDLPGSGRRLFAWLAANGVAEDELRRVFNIGIGCCAVVPAADVIGDLVIGTVGPGRGVTWA